MGKIAFIMSGRQKVLSMLGYVGFFDAQLLGSSLKEEVFFFTSDIGEPVCALPVSSCRRTRGLSLLGFRGYL